MGLTVVMNGVTKSYDGVSALQGVTTTIEDREIHGFFGSDRTGKTTLLINLVLQDIAAITYF